jgi:hypothetical protein
MDQTPIVLEVLEYKKDTTTNSLETSDPFIKKSSHEDTCIKDSYGFCIC